MINKYADSSKTTLRISFDAKADVKIGNLSRGGKNRKETKADDHDFGVDGKITPVGVFLPKDKDLFLYMVKSKTTSDCYVDVLEKCWKDISNAAGQGVKELVINLDNGPQQNSRRTQFMKRIQDFSNNSNLSITLAYYPPYHSKYNPIERLFGSLEKHWGGEILSTEEAVLGYAKTMKWAGKNPKVEVVDKVYEHGVKLTKKEMDELNAGFVRKSGIEKWFVQIRPRAG